ncbi:MAG: hypothetical protein KDD22_02385 [Bdellovibrionales bacterium]|nr:hypothetical protein [Bdellovibrionales bacterium]
MVLNSQSVKIFLQELFLGLLLSQLACGCASTSTSSMIPELDGGSQAVGAAYAGDSMHFRKSMPLHQDWRPMEFYFKECSLIDDKPYYSKTAYSCASR